jgi:site-specific DNA recombinase
LAERKGWAVVERYVDADISAYSGRLRPEYQRMLDDVEADAISAGAGGKPDAPAI